MSKKAKAKVEQIGSQTAERTEPKAKAAVAFVPRTTGSRAGREGAVPATHYGNIDHTGTSVLVYSVDGKKKDYVSKRRIGRQLFQDIKDGKLAPLSAVNANWKTTVIEDYASDDPSNPFHAAYAEVFG